MHALRAGRGHARVDHGVPAARHACRYARGGRDQAPRQRRAVEPGVFLDVARPGAAAEQAIAGPKAAPASPVPPSGPPANDPPPGDPTPVSDPFTGPAELSELPEDIETRPDGTPGSLAAYTPKAPEEVFIPREPAIMVALATRPKPWRMVNTPKDQAIPPAEPASEEEPARAVPPPPVSRPEKFFSGDALARFTSARFDPNAPVEPLDFSGDDSVVELELISTGGDPEEEARRAAMIAAHPEGKPIVTFRYGGKKPPGEPPEDTR
jgi:hypothetical protein